MAARPQRNTANAPKHCASKRIKHALSSIDRQMPTLTYLGLGFWIAWNTIGFSGAFWLHDTESSIRSENLVIVHLLACIVTLFLGALFAKRLSNVVAKNSFTYAGALIATVGTTLIVITKESILPSEKLFFLGCALSGIGTTILFFRSAALFGSLPPYRALHTLILCFLFSTVVYFIFAACPNEVASVGFILLPLASAVLFSLRYKNVQGESTVLRTHAPLPRGFIVMLLSIGLTSTAFELMHSYVLITLPPSYSTSVATSTQLIVIPIMFVALIGVLLAHQIRDSFLKLYSIIISALVIVLTIVSTLSLYSTVAAAIAGALCNCFNILIWAILYYLVYQSKANALEHLGLGNAALSLGTMIAGLISSAYHESYISDEAIRAALMVLGIIVLINVLFVFSEKQINSLLQPIDNESSNGETPIPSGKNLGGWISDVKRIAEQYQLSSRESEVLVALSRGRSAQEIADSNFLSIYTIRAHIRSVYAKLDVHSRKELLKFIEEHRESA